MFRSDFRREAWVGVFKILFYIGSKDKSTGESWHKIRDNIQRESNIYAVFHLVFSCFHAINCVFSCLYIVVYQHYISVYF